MNADLVSYLTYGAFGLLALGLLLFLLATWNILLRRQIQTRTQELRQALAVEGDRRFRDLFAAAPVALAKGEVDLLARYRAPAAPGSTQPPGY